jgi:hypothetical protein
VLRKELDCEVAMCGREADVAFFFDTTRLEEIFFIG